MPTNVERDFVLFVNDQLEAREYFSLMFGDDYTVLTASSSEDAWVEMRKHGDNLSVIIADKSADDQCGVDLLEAVSRRYPRIVRLLTTCYADLPDAISAVNHGDIYAYILKPWNIEEVGLDLRRATRLHHLEQERDLKCVQNGMTIQQTITSDRFLVYGVIASACSALIDHPLSAALAYYFDSTTYFNASRSTADGDPGSIEMKDQMRLLMVSARDISTWLSASISGRGMTVGDGAEIAMRIADTGSMGRHGSQPVVKVMVDERLFAAGLQALTEYLCRIAVQHGGKSRVSMAVTAANSGGLGVELRIDRHASADPAPDFEEILTESIGLRAYFAIHHHGGKIAIRQWGPDGGRVSVSLPSRSSQPSHDSIETFLAEICRQRSAD